MTNETIAATVPHKTDADYFSDQMRIAEANALTLVSFYADAGARILSTAALMHAQGAFPLDFETLIEDVAEGMALPSPRSAGNLPHYVALARKLHIDPEWFDVDAEPLKFPDSVQPEEREVILSAWHRWSANNNDGCDPESDIALINSLMAAAGIEAK
jgi:hypothetical protein